MTGKVGDITVDSSKGLISIKHADGSETTEEVHVKDTLITKPMGNVGYSAQITKNLGNYESAKISVSLYMPTDMEHLNSNFNFITDWVDSRINEVISSINS
jgi:hypothetical protein